MTEVLAVIGPLFGVGGVGLVLVTGINAVRDYKIAKLNQTVELERLRALTADDQISH